jgi:hypothetical protein
MPRKTGWTKAQRVTLFVAAIGALGALLAALIGIIPDLLQKKPSASNDTIEYSGRVLSLANGLPVENAKVTLAIVPLPLIRYTDSEGVYLFSLPASDLPLSAQISVTHPEYAPYTRTLSLERAVRQIEDIRLEPQSLNAVPETPALQTSAQSTLAINQWQVSYFGNVSLEGTPLAQAQMPLQFNDEGGFTLQFDPVQAGLSGAYSVRWVALLDLEAGAYELHCEHRDGCRIFVDSSNWIDAWWDGPGGHDLARELSAGPHRIVVEFYDQSGVGYLEVIMRKK